MNCSQSWGQIFALVNKYFIIRKRKFIQTLVELLLPIVLVTIIVYGSLNEPTKVNPLYPDPKPHPGDVIPLTFDDHVDFNESYFIQLMASPIYYVPNTSETRQLMTAASDLIRAIDPRFVIRLIPEKNQSTLEARWHKMTTEEQINSSGFLYFKNITGLTKQDGILDFYIEQNGIKFPSVNSPWRSLHFIGPDYTRDHSYGLLQLQIVVYQAYISLRRVKLTNSTEFVENVSNLRRFSTHRLPYPEHRVVGRSSILDQTPMIIAYSISITFTYFVFRTASERANSSIEMLLMSGMRRKIYWFTNFLSAYIIMAFVSTFQLTIIFSLTRLFTNSSFILVLIQVHVYIIQLILLGQLFTILFYRPIIASIISLIVFIVSFAMVDTLLVTGSSKYLAHGRRLACFLPNSALVLLFRIIVQKEIRGFGLEWHSINEPVGSFDDITAFEILILQVVSSFVYIILIWYVDQVWPIQSGIAKKYYFPLLPWLKKHQHASVTMSTDSIIDRHDSQNFQDELVDSMRVIECIGLTRVFKSSTYWSSDKMLAVDNLHLNVYNHSITCLLGHNGAGKTTTMNMITGMLRPTSGIIRINGIDLLKETRKARDKMSLCPQHNSLYDDLTVGEHLHFYAIMKGASRDTINDEISNTLKNLSLLPHVDKLPCQLSGGMKRKLCLAIALIAGSTIIILDEPSAGLDTESKREMWDILKRLRLSRTILLTTHDMEEADALADRIIIMNRGKVICSGSPMYLKKLFSPGYILRILKSSHYNHDAVLALISQLMPSAIIKSDNNSEVTFDLYENSDERRVKLSSFFYELERNKERLGIESFGVSTSTLEEVFTRAQSLDLVNSNNCGPETTLSDFASSDGDDDSLVEFNVHSNVISGFKLIIWQMYALLVKRFLDLRRSHLMVIFQLLIPPIIIISAFLLTNSNISFPMISKRQLLSPALYPGSHVFLQSNSDDSQMVQFEKLFSDQILSLGSTYDHLEGDANLTQYLVNQAALVSPEKFSHLFIYGLSLKRDTDGHLIYESWVNYQAYHAMPIIVSIIGQMEDKQVNRNNSINWPTIYLLPAHDTDQFERVPRAQMIWVMIISFSLTFMSAFYIFNPVEEVSSKFKLIQLMTGLHTIVYHLASFIFDLMIHIVSTGIIISCLYIFDSSSTITHSSLYNLTAIATSFILFGCIVIIINYILSSIPSSPSQGYLIIFIVFCVTGAILTIIASTFEYFYQQEIITWRTFTLAIQLFRVSPAFTISWMMKKLYENGIRANICSTIRTSLLSKACEKKIYAHCCQETCYDSINDIDTCVFESPFGWSGNRVNVELTVLMCQLIVTIIILMLKEYHASIFTMMRRELNNQLDHAERMRIDQDVMNERKFVNNLISLGETAVKTLVVSDLRKNYGKLQAVKGISFTVSKNECFGLLGVNGAGKSSTFAMLTGDTIATSGTVYQGTLDAFKNMHQYQRNIGYCPQVNPILTRLTGREMLVLIARLRGVKHRNIHPLCNRIIKLVNMNTIQHQLTGNYSGGGKRKLSIALATIGQPYLIYLDEPTAGVDPNARRVLWSTLMSIRDALNTSMILTSHSMDECEALCSRLSIMINGEFVCLGSPQHLKQKFGQAFTLTVRLSSIHSNQPDYVARFTAQLKSKLTYIELIDRCDVNVTYLIARNAGQWSHLFSTMEQMQEMFHLEDYLLTDTTLGQIFMHFLRLKNLPTSTIESS